MVTPMKNYVYRLALILVSIVFFSAASSVVPALAAPAPGKNGSMRQQSTMPVKTAAMAAQTEEQGLSSQPPPLPSESSACTRGTVAVAEPGISGTRAGAAEQSAPSAPVEKKKGDASLGKFSREALVGKQKADAAKPTPEKQTRKYTAKAAPDPNKKGTELADGRVTFSGSIPDHPNDRLKPQRAPLPGNAQSMSREEPASAPEMSVSYKVAEDTAARVTLNQQDETSPNYTPITKENSLVSTGVYVDLDVRENLQFQMGGEVRSIESDGPGTQHDSRETGASVGLRWNF